LDCSVNVSFGGIAGVESDAGFSTGEKSIIVNLSLYFSSDCKREFNNRFLFRVLKTFKILPVWNWAAASISIFSHLLNIYFPPIFFPRFIHFYLKIVFPLPFYLSPCFRSNYVFSLIVRVSLSPILTTMQYTDWTPLYLFATSSSKSTIRLYMQDFLQDK